MMPIHITAPQIIVLFAIYAFTGWIIEVAYRSATQRQLINAGFLYGPFIPIYGFGAILIVVLEMLIHDRSLFFKIITYGILLTSIEYATSFSLEKMFKLKLWDYSDCRFHLHGRVCLSFSMIWTIMALIFVTFVHPFVWRSVELLPYSFLKYFSAVLLVYGLTDFVFSIVAITDFRRKIAYLYTEYFNLSNSEIEKIFDSFKRLRIAFPHLSKYIENNIHAEIKNKISSFVKSVPTKVRSGNYGPKPTDSEFYAIISDIYEHEEFLKLKEHYHHNSSIYEHVMDVSYFSYRTCKFLKLDHHSAARGALLHDFFLYDWRNHDIPDLPEDKFHGIEHPKISLANARKHFQLNDIETDIIIKHMWPLTLVPPKYKESFIVSFADKYLASKEFVTKFKDEQVKNSFSRKSGARSLSKRRKNRQRAPQNK